MSAGAEGDDLAGGLVTSDDALVAFGALAEVLVVNAADIGAADGGGFHAQQDLAVARVGNGEFAQGVGASEWGNERERLNASELDGGRRDDT